MRPTEKQNYFTIVIPTRNRSDTLVHSLRTCIMQDYNNLEIIVSDNYSQDRTREVVESYKDSRVRYINTGQRLSMSENFEFALSHVSPRGYIIYIGDDDGLLPNAILDINKTINNTGAEVLRWDVASYFWPKLERRANVLSIPSLKKHIRKQNSRKTIEKVIAFKNPYQALPVMYMYSAVAYNVIARIKYHSDKFYHSLTPDVYSGFAIAGCINSFIESTRPYSVAGTSHNSNGASSSGVAQKKEYLLFLKENAIPFHDSLIQCNSVEVYVAESFFQAKDHLPYFNVYNYDIKKLMFQMMKTAADKQEAVYVEVRNAVLRLGEKNNKSKEAQKAIDDNRNRASENKKKSILSRIGRFKISKMPIYIKFIINPPISIDCSLYDVKNVYDASILCGQIFSLSDKKCL